MRGRIAVAFERAPVLVERLAALADAPPDRIVAEARRVIGRLDEAAQIEILNAHPRIGADAATLSERSRAEQGAAADATTLRELAALNEAYERKFGFRFVVFVAGRPKHDILPVLRERLERTHDVELATGLAEYLRIARDRLERIDAA